VLAATLLACSAIAAINAALDPYGLFRDTRGRPLRVITNERTSKYLLAQRYVPENFDAVLVGTSISSNWDTRRVSGYRMYNCSLNGANISEASLIARPAIERGNVKLAAFVVYTYLTLSHGLKSQYMTERDRWSAFGSVMLFQTYAFDVLSRVGAVPSLYDEFGGYAYHRKSAKLNPKQIAQAIESARSEKGTAAYAVDPVALDEYRALLDLARAKGAKVVAIVPPFYQPKLDAVGAEYAAYQAKLMPLFGPSDIVVDLNTSAYRALREDPANFHDHTHLSPRGADQVMDALAAALRASAVAGG
jgi:hypothetical protein